MITIKLSYLVEALATANDRSPIIVANAIVTPDVANDCGTRVPIWLANPSSDPITLHRGTKVAKISPVSDSELVTKISQERESTPTKKELPPKAKEVLWKMVENSGEVLDSHQQQELYTFLLGFADVFAFTNAELGRTDKL